MLLSTFILLLDGKREKGGEEVTNRSHEKRQGESENEEDESGI